MSLHPDPRHPTYETLRKNLYPAHLRKDVILAPYTTFQIGGPADFFVEVTSVDELATAVTVAKEIHLPFFLLGLGANVLVGDNGFRGLVIRNVANHTCVKEDTHCILAESGVVIYPDLVQTAIDYCLSGLEHYAGIPSTVGGALRQNLHFLSPPPDRERTLFISEILVEAEILSEEGDRRTVDADYFEFGYDYSVLHVRRDAVLTATFQLEPGHPRRMREIVEANLTWRRERHPPLDSEPSAGSIFKKIEGIGAGRLIDQCGLKGTRIGGAEVTQRHANIIVNKGGATAADVYALINHVQETVERHTGLRLEPEIAFVGSFDPPPKDRISHRSNKEK